MDLLAPVDLPVTTRDEAASRGVPDVLAALTTPGWVAVTPALAADQGWAEGDTVTVSSGSRTTQLVIGALVDFQAVEPLAPRTLAVMDIAQAQARLARPGLIHQIDIQLRDGADPHAAAARLGAALGPIVQVVTPEQRNQDARGLLAAFRLNLTALSMISVFVGVFLVLTTVQASLARRRGEFGLLRCLGARPAQVVGFDPGRNGRHGPAGCDRRHSPGLLGSRPESADGERHPDQHLRPGRAGEAGAGSRGC